MRFSIRSILILTAVVAFFSGLFFVLPDFFAVVGLTLVGLLTPSCLISGIVFARGHFRAFAIGAMIPATWMLLYTVYVVPISLLDGDDIMNLLGSHSALTYKIGFLIEYALIAMSGGAAVVVRQFCVGSKGQPVAHSHAANHSSEPIEPLTKAELYRILEGRMQLPVAANGSGLTSKAADPAFDSLPPR